MTKHRKVRKRRITYQRRLTSLQKMAFGLLLVVLVFSPVFFGSVHVWAYSLFSLAAFAAVGLLLIQDMVSLFQTRQESCTRLWRTPVDVVVLLFAGVIVVQLLPWSESLVELLSPHLADIRQTVKSVTGHSISPTLSVVPYSTSISALLFAAYACLFYGLVRLLLDRDKMVLVLKVLLTTGIGITIYGMLEKWSGHNHILWWENEYFGANRFRMFGTFINPNHFGLYLEMIFGLGLGWLYALHRPAQKDLGAGVWKRFKKMVVEQETGEELWQKQVLLLFLLALVLCVLVLTGSRGALFSCLLGMCVFFWALSRKSEQKRGGLILGLIIVLTLFFAIRAGIMPVWNRLNRLTLENVVQHRRVKHNLAALKLWADYPLLGSGMGTFEELYPAYQVKTDSRLRKYLHCDWLQMATEAGSIGFVLVLGGYVVLVVYLWRGVQQRQDRLAVGLGLGALFALVSVGAHSLMDFGLRMPGNVWTLAAVAALGVVGVRGKKRGRGGEEEGEKVRREEEGEK